MTPRPDIVSVAVDQPVDEIIQAFAAASHSRLPVYEENPDNVIGILYAKDLLQALRPGAPGRVDLRALLRSPVFVFEHQHVDDVLALFWCLEECIHNIRWVRLTIQS